MSIAIKFKCALEVKYEIIDAVSGWSSVAPKYASYESLLYEISGFITTTFKKTRISRVKYFDIREYATFIRAKKVSENRGCLIRAVYNKRLRNAIEILEDEYLRSNNIPPIIFQHFTHYIWRLFWKTFRFGAASLGRETIVSRVYIREKTPFLTSQTRKLSLTLTLDNYWIFCRSPQKHHACWQVCEAFTWIYSGLQGYDWKGPCERHDLMHFCREKYIFRSNVVRFLYVICGRSPGLSRSAGIILFVPVLHEKR